MDGLLSNERELLARMIQAEAGNQGELGMRAVAAVMDNRRRAQGYGGSTFRDVLLAPGQFSPANSITGYAGGEQGVDLTRLQPSPTAYQVADAVMGGQYDDPTGGALNFLNPNISQPSWLSSMQNTIKIGDHLFGTAASGEGSTGRAGGNMQPQGLLGTMSTRNAQEPERLPFFQRPGTADLFDTLAVGLSGMSMRPNQALIQAAQERMGARRETAQTQQQRNATAAWLESQGLAQLAEGVRSGAITGAQALTMAQGQQPTKGVPVGDRLVNPVTGEVIYEPSAEGRPQLDKDQLSALNTIRDDVRAELAPFEIVKSGYNNIITFYENPGSTSDYALAVAFAKILDPGSVAREGEVQAVQNAGARVPALGQALRNAITGEGALTPKVRQEIAQLATEIYKERSQAAQTTLSQYSDLATRAGIPPEFVYAGQIPEVRGIVPAVVPPAALAQGVTQEMWDAATPEEKAAWSK